MKMHLIKSLTILAIIVYVAIIVCNFSYAAFDVTGTFDGTTSAKTINPVKKVFGTILDVVRTVGMGMALIILVIVGIKIMMAAPSERANIKQYCMNYVIGAFILIGASTLVTLVKEFTEKAIVAK